MSRCKFFEYAFFLVPLKKWQDLLIRVHMGTCPECQKSLVNREIVQGITAQEIHYGSAESFWDGFEHKVREAKRSQKNATLPRLRWAYGVTVVVLFAAAAIWFALAPQIRKARIEASLNEHFCINYIRIEDKPAQAYIFKPQDSQMIIVWAQKNIRGE